MISHAVNSSRIQKLQSYFLLDCFESGKVLAGTTHKACADRAALYQELNVQRENAVGLAQCHSARFARVTSGALQEIPETDALVTEAKGVLLTVRTADCVPVFVFDPSGPAIAMIHAGWKGSQLGIVKKTVSEMASRNGSRIEQYKIAFGPSIRSCCYEFDPDHVAEFRPFMKPVNGKHHFDLPAYLTRELEGMGIEKSSVFDSGICTFCNPQDFFSYRREKENPGRMISFMMLK